MVWDVVVEFMISASNRHGYAQKIKVNTFISCTHSHIRRMHKHAFKIKHMLIDSTLTTNTHENTKTGHIHFRVFLSLPTSNKQVFSYMRTQRRKRSMTTNSIPTLSSLVHDLDGPTQHFIRMHGFPC